MFQSMPIILFIQLCYQDIKCMLKAYFHCEMRSSILENMKDTKLLSENDLAKGTKLLIFDALHLISMCPLDIIKTVFSIVGFLKNLKLKIVKDLHVQNNPLTWPNEISKLGQQLIKIFPLQLSFAEKVICEIFTSTQVEQMEDNEFDKN